MTTPTLPQRIPGATVPNALQPPPDREACHFCANGQRCDWHWAPAHRDRDECECCVGRYARCRNTTKETS